MKKFILALVLVVMVGMDTGCLVFAAGNVIDALDKQKGGNIGSSNAASDSAFTDDGGSYGDIDFQLNEEDACEAKEPAGRYEYKDGNCVDLSTKCADNEFWDSTNNVCKNIDAEFSKVCKEKGLEYDPVVGKCYYKDEQSTILPGTRFSETQCEELFTYGASHLGILKDVVSGKKKDLAPKDFLFGGSSSSENVIPLDVLGCGIKTGRISMWMIPFFVKYLIQFAISIAGLVAVGAIIIGGYFYLFSGLDNDKERGKKAIMYGLLGFIVVLLAWTIVNAAIGLFTR